MRPIRWVRDSVNRNAPPGPMVMIIGPDSGSGRWTVGCLPPGIRTEPVTLYRTWSPERVVRSCLEQALVMITGSHVFTVFCHIDYAVRY